MSGKKEQVLGVRIQARERGLSKEKAAFPVKGMVFEEWARWGRGVKSGNMYMIQGVGR